MWFVTWDRPEYKEWAKEIDGGYLLVILRIESDGKLLCVKARLNMGAKGMPVFVIEVEQYAIHLQDAQAIIDAWKK